MLQISRTSVSSSGCRQREIERERTKKVGMDKRKGKCGEVISDHCISVQERVCIVAWTRSAHDSRYKLLSEAVTSHMIQRSEKTEFKPEQFLAEHQLGKVQGRWEYTDTVHYKYCISAAYSSQDPPTYTGGNLLTWKPIVSFCFWWSLFCTPRLNAFDQKYSKTEISIFYFQCQMIHQKSFYLMLKKLLLLALKTDA